MADDINDLENDANEGEAEGTPEALSFLQGDRRGNNDNRRWRYAVRDVETLEYAGPGVWTQVGPAPLLVANQQIFQGIGPDSGEVVDIAIDPRPGILYIATGSGGVWKSTDDGVSWRPVTDHLPAMSIGAIALDPGNPDIVYAGTGNLFEGAAGMPKSAGLFKSTDGGRTWARLGSPVGRPPRPITAAANGGGGVQVTVAAHGYVTFDRVAALGLPGMVGAGAEGVATRIDNNRLRIGGVTMNAAYGGAGATLYDARQPPFLSDRGVVRMVCPAPDTLLVATQTGLYLSRDGGRNFGANPPAYDDGRPIRNGLISALEIDQGWMRVARVGGATPAQPIVVTVPRHGFATGDRVFLGGVESNRAANGGWLADRIDDDHFSLRGSFGNGTGAVSGFALGPAHPSTKPVQGATNPGAPNPIVITSAAHGFITGDIVAISGVGGNTAANRSWTIRVLTADTFALNGSRGNGVYAANTGTIDGPVHRPPTAITAAVNGGGGITATVVGHGLTTGDRVSVLGLPGVVAPANSAQIRRLDGDRFVLTKLALNAAYGGAGATFTGPSDAYATAYFVSAGRGFQTNQLNPERGLFRLAISSTGDVVLSDNLLAHPGGVGGGGFGRVAFAQSLLPNTRTLYASVQDNEPTSFSTPVFVGLFRSDDFGATWARQPNLATRANIDGGGQSSYDLTIGVDPQNPQLVYAALQQLWRSTNGGQAWPLAMPVNHGGLDALTGIGRSPSTTLLHWDHHELVFPPPTRWAWTAGNPVAPTPAYLGTDGGIARSGDAGGVMTFTHLNEGISTSLLRHIDIGRGANKNAATYAGMQDTGTAGHRPGDAGTAWTEGIDGDGGFVAVDPFDPNIAFGFDNERLIRTTNGGATWFDSGFQARPQIVSVHNENPVRIVTTGHTFRTGDFVFVSGVTGGGGLANGNCQITVVNANEFRLNGKNGTAVAAFGTGPTATGDRYLAQATINAATLAAPIEIETTAPHGCINGQRVRIDGVEGNVAANNSAARPTWTVTVTSPTRLTLNGSDGSLSAPYVRGTGRMLGPQVAGTVPIARVENANPMVVTAQGHGFMSGDVVTVAGVLGTTSANGAALPIRVLDANCFELVGRAGNAAFANGPRVSGQTIGRGLPVVGTVWPPRRRVAIVPNPGAAATTIFASYDAALFRSTDGGVRFTQVNAFADPVTALHAPAPTRLWVGTAGRASPFRPGRVLFSADNGAHFNAVPNFVSDVGAQGAISAIAEDPNVAGGTRVAVVASGYSETATTRRTRHCFLTVTGGVGAGAWTEAGGTFNALTGNLPDIPVMGVGWDTTVAANPSVLLVASDSGVLRLGPGNVWQRVGPNLPNVSCQALAIDNTVNPPVIRVGTYGRGAWQLTVPAGPSLYVEADLGFGEQRIGTTTRRRLVLHSVGSAEVRVTGISGAGGDITLVPVPAGPLTFPIVLASGARSMLDVVFKPTAAGDRGAFLMVSSTDPARPSVELKATGFGVAAGRPRLSVRAFVEFGTVRVGSPAHFGLELRNIGNASLTLTRVALDPASSPRFSLGLTVPPAAGPVIAPGDAVTVDVGLDVLANGPLRGAVIVEGGGQGAIVSLGGTGTTTAAGMVAKLFDVLGLGDPPEVLV